jgi:hypothetical protein
VSGRRPVDRPRVEGGGGSHACIPPSSPFGHRFVFIPLFLLCNVHTGLPSIDDQTDVLPRLFKSDAVPYVLMFLLGTTNG